MFQGHRYRRRPDTPPEQGKSSSPSSAGGRSATNISSLMAASSPARGRIHTALETQPADPRRLKSSRTPTDDAHEPTTLAERRRALIRMKLWGRTSCEVQRRRKRKRGKDFTAKRLAGLTELVR